MKRRDLLKGAASLPTMLPVIAQAQQNPMPPKPTAARTEEEPRLEAESGDATADAVPNFFTAEQFARLRELSGLILPRVGSTPGALDAGVPELLDFLIGRSPGALQKLYREGLGRPIHLAPLAEPWTYEPPRDPYARFLQQAKHDILTASVNSREWIAAVNQRNPAVTGTGDYWLPVE